MPSQKDSGQKHAGGTGFSAASVFQHGLGYDTTNSQGHTFDYYGRRVFGDDEEQTVEGSSDEEREVSTKVQE